MTLEPSPAAVATVCGLAGLPEPAAWERTEVIAYLSATLRPDPTSVRSKFWPPSAVAGAVVMSAGPLTVTLPPGTGTKLKPCRL